MCEKNEHPKLWFDDPTVFDYFSASNREVQALSR